MRKLIRRSTIAEKLDLGRTSLWRLEKSDPRFPRPVKIGDGIERFDEAEADAYIDALLADRGEARAA